MTWYNILKRRPLKINKPLYEEKPLVGSKPREIYEHFRDVAYNIELMRVYLYSFVRHVIRNLLSGGEPTPFPVLLLDATNYNTMASPAKLAVREKVSIKKLLNDRVSLVDLITDYQNLIRNLLAEVDEKREELYDINNEPIDGEEIYLPIYNTILDSLEILWEYLTRFESTHKQFINNQEQIVMNKRGN